MLWLFYYRWRRWSYSSWRYDLPAHEYPDKVTGYNRISLNNARNNYKLFKASKEEFLGTNRIREPFSEELLENNI